MIFLVLSSAIGLAVIQNFSSDESQTVRIDDFFFQTTMKKIKLSDGVGTDSTG